MVDRLPHRPEHRRGDERALHQAASGLLIERKRAFDSGAVCRRNLVQDTLAAIVLEIVQQERCIVGIQMPDHGRDGCVGQLVQGFETRSVREFGHRLGRQVLAQQVDRLPERFRRQLFEQVGKIGGVKLPRRAPQERLVAIAHGADHLRDEGRRNHAGIVHGFDVIGFDGRLGRVRIAGVIHGDLPAPNGVLSHEVAGAVEKTRTSTPCGATTSR